VPNKGHKTKVRLNLKIDSDLRNWAMVYARRHNTTVTTIICELLQGLRRDEEQSLRDIVEQI
jgi:hypothetical protein